MKTKMTFDQLKAMFPEPLPSVTDDNILSDATRKNHKHTHNPSRRPHIGKISPTEYRRRHLGKRK